MQIKHPSPLRLAWYRWKGLSLPWRKRRFVGYDFHGNTFWIFRDPGGYVPVDTWRRIVQAPGKSHFSDLKVPPVWHQWLRHVRAEPPTIEEQIADVRRQEATAQLAQRASARWAAKPRVADMTEAERRLLEEARNVLGSSRPSVHVRAGAGVPEDTASRARETETQAVPATATAEDTAPPSRPSDPSPIPHALSELKRVKATLPLGMADPWANAKNPGDNWQPESWVPPVVNRR
ncbi:hypothetical protein BROUX41_004303 [Berkeleyomyces rouxiae]